MPYQMSIQEIEKLEHLVGEEVSAEGSCIAQDEYGVAHHCPISPHSGILRKINYDPVTKELRSVFIDQGKDMVEVNFNTKSESYTWDIHKAIYHNNQAVLSVLPERA